MKIDKKVNRYMSKNDEKIKQWVAWADYFIGFSGVGTTALDVQPDFLMPDDIPDNVVKELKKAGKEWAKHKWECWCDAAKDVDDYCVPENWKCPKFLLD